MQLQLPPAIMYHLKEGEKNWETQAKFKAQYRAQAHQQAEMQS